MGNTRKTLEYIKSHPRCNSHNLDCRVVKTLHDNNLVDGFDTTSSSSIDKDGVSLEYEYEELEINFNGEEYLSSPTNEETRSLWRTEKIFLPVLIVVITIALTIYFVK